MSGALPMLLLLLPLLLAPGSASAQNAAAATPLSPAKQKECCSALAAEPGFEAAATGPVTVPVLILTLPAPLPDKKRVEVVGRLCECGASAAGSEEEGEGEGPQGLGVAAAADVGGSNSQNSEEEQPWVRVRVRGSTSAREFSKKSFSLNFVAPPTPKTDDVDGKKRRPPSFLGMPMADGKFALAGVQDDRTLGARTSLTFDAFRQGMGRWAPRTRRAELFVRVEVEAAAPAQAAAAAATAPNAVAAAAEIAPLPPAAAAATAIMTPTPTASPRLQYRGVYIASERVTRAKARVDVAAYKPGRGAAPGAAGRTGGFLVAYENDNIAPGEPIFATRASRLTFVVEDPSAKTLANGSAMAAAAGGGGGGAPSSPSSLPPPSLDPLVYLTDFFNGLERALLAPGPLVQLIEEPITLQQPPENEKQEPRATLAALPPLAPFLDVAAAADYFLITEISKSPDGYRGSIKMHKDAGQPLVIGTPWDYGEAYGTCCGFPLEGYRQGGRSGPGASGGSAISPQGWRFNVCADPGRCLVEPADGTSQWFRRLWQDGSFRAGVAERWRRLRAGALNDTFFVAAVDASESALGAGSGAAGRNYALWTAELPARPEEMMALERAGAMGGAGLGAVGAVLGGPAAAAAAAASPSSSSPPPPPPQFVAANLALRQWVLARLAWMDRALAAQADPAAAA